MTDQAYIAALETTLRDVVADMILLKQDMDAVIEVAIATLKKAPHPSSYDVIDEKISEPFAGLPEQNQPWAGAPQFQGEHK